MPNINFTKSFARVMFREFTVPEALTLPEWADRYRILSKSNSARPGPWQTQTINIARGPMLAVDEPGVETITLMVATQLLKSSLLENVIARHIHLDPCPIMLVQPKDEAADAFSKERIQPMIDDTPVLAERVAKQGGRRGENTIEYKKFPNGFLVIVGAGSPTNVAMRPIRVVLLDEIDKYQPTVEGDPVSLAEERASTFPNRLKIRACSPTTEETSRIWASWLLSDQRRPYVNCPHCDHMQTLDFFRHVHWEKRAAQHDPETARVFCEACNKPWEEAERIEALENIMWLQTRTFHCCGEGQDPRATRAWDFDFTTQTGYALCTICGQRAVPNRHAGFTASKLYSPLITMAELAANWLHAKLDPESKQTFYNTQLALPYKMEALKEVSSTALVARSEVWNAIPDEVCVITAGVDVHPGSVNEIGRLELETVGWSATEESWSLAYEIFSGDPAQPEVWKELDDFLLKPFVRSDGRHMKILAACIDTGGHNTQEAYRFAAARVGRNVWGIKGASDRGGQWSPVWPARDRKRKAYRPGYRPIIIGVNAAKEAVRQRLLITQPGPGYCHFPAGRPAGYYEQLTAERLIVERKGGSMVRRWDLQSHRTNEALDVRVYAYAALQGLVFARSVNLAVIAARLAALAPLEAREPVQAEAVEAAETGASAPVFSRPPIPPGGVSPALAARARQPQRSSFMTVKRW
jgi:phage terminase large subunit GpA-like protein